jgi:hypothetical protein
MMSSSIVLQAARKLLAQRGVSDIAVGLLTLILLTWTKWWAPASASKWRMGFNSAFKWLINLNRYRNE